MSTPDTSRHEADIHTTHEMKLAVLATPALQGQPHRLVLTALMAAYLRVAFANPCCTPSCAQQTFHAALLLSQQAAAERPEGTSIH